MENPKIEEELVEIVCDAKENYLIYDEKGNPLAKDLKGVIDVMCSYTKPIKLKFKTYSLHQFETKGFILEKIAELHNNLIYSKKKIEDYESEIQKVIPLLEKLKTKK